MTLFKQIIIIITIFQTIIFGFVMMENFQNISESVKIQLGANAQHTANSLGLSITTYMQDEKPDIATIESMINALFDSGDYQMISLQDIDGKILIDAKGPISVPSVPSWFLLAFDIKAPVANSLISDGWIQYGTLKVQSNVGVAYHQLWQTAKDIATTFIIITLIAFFILYFILRYLLEPLKRIEKQALAISKKTFTIEKEMPKTTELKQVAIAMNGMIGTVKDIFDKEVQTADRYEELAYKDKLTGLANRRKFVLTLEEYLKTEEDSSGMIVFASLTNPHEIKSEIGYQNKEALYKELASELEISCKKYPQSLVASMKEGDFALLYPSFDREKTFNICNMLMTNIKKILSKYSLDEQRFFFNFGFSPYFHNAKTSEIFSQADFALSAAKAKGAFLIEFHGNEEGEVVRGKEAWKKEISDALEDKRFIFAAQEVVDEKDNTYHHELLLRLQDVNHAVHPAAYFMPTVNQLGLNWAIDKYVIDSLRYICLETSLPVDAPICINLGKELLLEQANLLWFEDKIKYLKEKIDKEISFEISNRTKIDINALKSFAKLLNTYGYNFGLDNFQLEATNLRLLQELNPNYIKILASTLLDVHKDNISGFSSKQSLDIIASSMDVKVIALGVETKEQAQILKQMGIKYMQGSFIEEPHLI